MRRGDGFVEKRLSARERSEPEAVLRLRSEADLLAKLTDVAPGLTPALLARGEDAAGPWHRVRAIPFPTIAERVEAGGPLSATAIESGVPAALEALARLHEAADERGPLAIVHADLSPANLAFDEASARFVILDLDLALWRDGWRGNDGAFRGTLAYVAPEVARGERPTVRSDLFSLAAVLLFAATGAPPRDGPSFAALLASAAEAPIFGAGGRPSRDADGLAARGPGHRLLVTCLALELAQRPASARAALAAALC